MESSSVWAMAGLAAIYVGGDDEVGSANPLRVFPFPRGAPPHALENRSQQSPALVPGSAWFEFDDRGDILGNIG